MVGPLMLVKMLHCKRMTRKKSLKSRSKDNDSDQGPSRGNTSSEITLKIEQIDEEEQLICRVCLKDGNIPIYGNDFTGDISDDLISITAIDVRNDDEYPKYLCQSCFSLLQGAIMLRKTAQESEQFLRRSDDISFHDDEALNDTDEEEMPYQYHEKEDEYNKYKKPAQSVDTCYHCRKCNLDFKTLDEYTEHRMSIEHENMKIPCPVCGNMYNNAYLKKHLLYHKMEAAFMCDICGKKFIIQGQFTRHRATHFLDKLPYECTLCPYKGRYSESLKMHMRSHTGEKPYQCPECPSRFFVNKSNLNKHLLTHRNTHDFKCGQCQRGFYTQKDLDSHYKVDHSGIKDHICDVCGKAFGYRKQMMKHQLKVHKRDKMRSGRTPLYLLMESKKRAEEQQNAI